MVKDGAILLLAVGQTLVWAGTYYFFPAMLLRWETELGWSKVELTSAISIAILVSAIFSPVAGKLIDSGKGPILMSVSAVTAGICLLLLARVTVILQFYVIWAVIGATLAGCLYEPCFAIITRARGKHAKRAITLITLIAGFASTLSFSGAHALSEMVGWRTATSLTGLMLVLVVAPLFWLGANSIERSGAGTTGQITKYQVAEAKFWKHKKFWFLACGFSVLALVHGATLHHLLSILNEYEIAIGTAVLAASFIGPMQVVGRLIMVVTEKFTSNHMVAIAAFVMMISAIAFLLASASKPLLLPAFVVLFGASYGTISILRPVLARDILGERGFGAKSGALAMGYLASAAVSPYLGAIVWQASGYKAMLVALVVIAVAGLCCYLLAHRSAQH